MNKGLFSRRRMFLLKMGRNLYYVDPSNMVLLKGHTSHFFYIFFTFILYYLRIFVQLTVVRKNKCEKNAKQCEKNVEKMW